MKPAHAEETFLPHEQSDHSDGEQNSLDSLHSYRSNTATPSESVLSDAASSDEESVIALSDDHGRRRREAPKRLRQTTLTEAHYRRAPERECILALHHRVSRLEDEIDGAPGRKRPRSSSSSQRRRSKSTSKKTDAPERRVNTLKRGTIVIVECKKQHKKRYHTVDKSPKGWVNLRPLDEPHLIAKERPRNIFTVADRHAITTLPAENNLGPLFQP